MAEQRIWRWLTPNTEYRISVQARIKGLVGDAATIDHTTSSTAQLQAPQNVKAIPFPLIKWIIVSWDPIIRDDNSVVRHDISYYKIERRNVTSDPNAPYQEMSRSQVSFFMDSGKHGAYRDGNTDIEPFPLQMDNTYQYRITAITRGDEESLHGESDYASLGKPATPVIDSSTWTFDPHDVFQFQGEATFRFSDPTGAGAEWYEFVARRQLSDGSWGPWMYKGKQYHSGAGYLPQTAVLSAMPSGQTFQIGMRAFNGVFYYSNWATAMTASTTDTEAPSLPANVDADITPWVKNIFINWSPVIVSDLKRYRLYEYRGTTLPALTWDDCFRGIDDPNNPTSLASTVTDHQSYTIRDVGLGSTFVRKRNAMVSDYSYIDASAVESSYYRYWVIPEDRHGNWSVTNAIGNYITAQATAKMGKPAKPNWASVPSSWDNLIFSLPMLKVYNITAEWGSTTGADFGYLLKWKKAGTTKWWPAFIPEPLNDTGVVSFTLPLAFHNQTYEFELQAWNAYGLSDIRCASLTVTEDTTPPDPPSLVHTGYNPTVSKLTSLGMFILRIPRTSNTVAHSIAVNNTSVAISAVHLMDAWGISWGGFDYIFFNVHKIRLNAPSVWNTAWSNYYFWVTNNDYAGNHSDYVYCGYLAADKLNLDLESDLQIGSALDVSSGGVLDIDGTINMNYGGDINFKNSSGTLCGLLYNHSSSNSFIMGSDNNYSIGILANDDLQLNSGNGIYIYAGPTGLELGSLSGGPCYIYLGGIRYRCGYGAGGYMTLTVA